MGGHGRRRGRREREAVETRPVSSHAGVSFCRPTHSAAPEGGTVGPLRALKSPVQAGLSTVRVDRFAIRPEERAAMGSIGQYIADRKYPLGCRGAASRPICHAVTRTRPVDGQRA